MQCQIIDGQLSNVRELRRRKTGICKETWKANRSSTAVTVRSIRLEGWEPIITLFNSSFSRPQLHLDPSRTSLSRTKEKKMRTDCSVNKRPKKLLAVWLASLKSSIMSVSSPKKLKILIDTKVKLTCLFINSSKSYCPRTPLILKKKWSVAVRFHSQTLCSLKIQLLASWCRRTKTSAWPDGMRTNSCPIWMIYFKDWRRRPKQGRPTRLTFGCSNKSKTDSMPLTG